MPSIEIKIMMTVSEVKLLNKELDDLSSLTDCKKTKQTVIQNVHLLINQYIKEAYELGKIVGEADLD